VAAVLRLLGVTRTPASDKFQSNFSSDDRGSPA
jgi:hypothetical protein